ncbi:MAG: strawberry notch-like NTP hydrolase domain-containing protein, partial [Thermoguttaceae bacterium]
MISYHNTLSRSPATRSGRRHVSDPNQRLLDFDRPADVNLDTATLPSLESPVALFARRVAAILETEPAAKLDNMAMSRIAQEILGSSAGHARDAYDAAEAGLNLYLHRKGIDFRDVSVAIDQLLAIQTRLPVQNRRDQTQIEFQQFSTPPAEALVVAKTAALCPGMSVLEPSAGTGNIAVLARLLGAQVDTNEIDPRRRELLSLQGFEPTAFDAERLDNLFPPERTYHAVVMNPPFSATGGRVNGHRTIFGARHIEQALLRLKPGGRLVAIVGCGMADDRPKFREWWTAIGNRYHVRANVGVDGREYARFGTTFGNQIIVIDRNGQTTDEAAIVTGTSLSIQEAFHLLEHLSKENVYGRVCRANQHTGGNGHAADIRSRTDAGRKSASGIDRASVGGQLWRSPTAAERADHEPTVARLALLDPHQSTGLACSNGFGSAIGAERIALGPGSHADLGGFSFAPHARSIADNVGQLETAHTPQVVDIEEGTVFAAYRVQKAVVRGSLPHPANVVESTAMACVEPPDVTYRHHLPAEVIVEGRVSNLQIEDVIYAGQAARVILPDGSRKGHWNGDGTGIGKGREIYAYIYNELAQGRRKHVHISAAHQLAADAERDRSAVGLPIPLIHQAR